MKARRAKRGGAPAGTAAAGKRAARSRMAIIARKPKQGPKARNGREKRAAESGCCAMCEFWDHRTESGMDECTGFCVIKRKIVHSKYRCRDFSEKGQEGEEMAPEFIEGEGEEGFEDMEDMMDYE